MLYVQLKSREKKKNVEIITIVPNVLTMQIRFRLKKAISTYYYIITPIEI